MDNDDRNDLRIAAFFFVLAVLALLFTAYARADVDISNDGAGRWQCVELIDGERIPITDHVTQSEATECLINQQQAHPEREFRAVSSESLRATFDDPDQPPTEPPDDPHEPPPEPPDEPPTEPPTEPPDEPPTNPLTSIPPIPFDYVQQPSLQGMPGTLPASLGAGDVLALADASLPGDNEIVCSGTETAPAFILGGAIRGDGNVLRVGGSWCIFDGTVFDNVQVRTSGDHHVFRNAEIAHVAGKNGSSFGGSNIVVVDSEIHHNQGDDRHGVHVSGGADSVWLLRNHIHHNGGDGFQACHGCSANPPRNVYIGGNLFHSDRENAIDFKYIENVIVEGNTIHSLVEAPKDQQWCFDDGTGCGVFSSGSDGSGIVVGSDGAPTGVVITGNEIYGTVNAIRIEEGDGVQIVDNNFHDISGRCLQLDKQGQGTVFRGNTCEEAGRGIFQNWRVNFSVTVDANTFRDVTGPSIEYESGEVAQASTLTNNLFENSGPVIYNNINAATAEQINSLLGAADNRVE